MAQQSPQRGSRRQESNLGLNVIMIALAIGAIGFAFGLMPTVYGSFVEEPVETGTEEQLENSEQEEISEEKQDKQKKNGVVRLVFGITPYLAILLGGLAGVAAAVQIGGTSRDVLLTAAAGAFVGGFLFVFVSTALATFQWAPVEFGSEGKQIAELQWGALLVNSLTVGAATAIAGALSGLFTDRVGSQA